MQKQSLLDFIEIYKSLWITIKCTLLLEEKNNFKNSHPQKKKKTINNLLINIIIFLWDKKCGREFSLKWKIRK